MEKILDTPPPLTPLSNPGIEPSVRTLDETVSAHAAVLREDPAIRSLTEVVRGTPELWDQITPFIQRRDDFRDPNKYNIGSRVFAPLLTGITRATPELMDVSLQFSAAQKSETIREALEASTEQGIEPYISALIVGTGPQSQIFNAELQAELAGTAIPTLTIERENHVGGTFRPGETMNFKLNSRTRPQTDERPKPGTSANLNDLRPGVLTPGDTSAEAYIDAEDFGRVVTVNHAFSTSVCLGMTLESLGPNPAAESGQPGRVLAVLRDEVSNKRYMVRTDALVVPNGLGKEKAGASFDDEISRSIIEAEAATHKSGGRAQVLTFEQFARQLKDPNVPFPLRGRRRIAVVGKRDGGKVAIGQLLGYEPRSDGSTTQLDFVESVTWYGQDAETQKKYVESNRLRNALIGLDMPRTKRGEDRYTRIVPLGARAVSLRRASQDTITIQDDKRSSKRPAPYDLVILADGYEYDTATELKDMVFKPLTITEAEAILDPESPQELKAGDLVEYASNYSLRSIQVVATSSDTVKVKFTKPDGTYGYFESPNNANFRETYLDEAAITGREVITKPFSFPGIVSFSEVRALSEKKQMELVKPGTIYWGYDGSRRTLLKIGEANDKGTFDATPLRIGNTYTAFQDYPIKLSADSILSDLRSLGFGITNAPYYFDAPGSPENGYTSLPFAKVGTAGILELLNRGEITSGSIIRNSSSPSVVTLLQTPGESYPGYRFSYIDSEGFNLDSRTTKKRMAAWIAAQAIDSVAFAPTTVSETTFASNSINVTKTTLDFTELIAPDSQGGRAPVALQDASLPIYIAGPAARLPVDRDLVSLVPSIPEYAVSVFGSSERVRNLAKLLAQDVLRGQRFTKESEVLTVTKKTPMPTIIGPLNRDGSERKRASGPEVYSIQPRPRRFEPELPTTRQSQAVRLALGALSRQANFSTLPNEFIRLGVNIEPGPSGTLVCTYAPNNGRLVSGFKTRQQAFVDYLIGDPLVSDFLKKQFTVHPSVELGLVFDQRGLDIRATEINPQRSSTKARPVAKR